MIFLKTVKGDKKLKFLMPDGNLFFIHREDGRSALQLASYPDGKTHYNEQFFRNNNKVNKGKFDIL